MDRELPFTDAEILATAARVESTDIYQIDNYPPPTGIPYSTAHAFSLIKFILTELVATRADD